MKCLFFLYQYHLFVSSGLRGCIGAIIGVFALFTFLAEVVFRNEIINNGLLFDPIHLAT